MGVLVPVIHPMRLVDRRHGAALLRELGIARVDAIATLPAADAAPLLAALGDRDCSLRLFEGALGASVYAAIAPIIALAPESLALHAPGASVHVWGTTATVTVSGERTELAAADALARFAELAGPVLELGWVTRPSPAIRAVLPEFLRALGGELAIDVTLACDDAAALLADCESTWNANAETLRFPDGEIETTILASPTFAADEARWLAAIDAALARLP